VLDDEQTTDAINRAITGLVVSADQYNRSPLTVTVVAVTSTAQLAGLPGNVVVPSDSEQAALRSSLLGSQVRSARYGS
jgi:mRNA-degrading endonuclease toxin of MazEF toxin-antitoxin module